METVSCEICQSVALRKEATGAPTGFRSDVVAVAKRTLNAGQVLDGEGGHCVWGRQIPAAQSLARGFLPLGIAQGVKLKHALAQGQCVKWSDVTYDIDALAVRVRRDMEKAFAPDRRDGRGVGT